MLQPCELLLCAVFTRTQPGDREFCQRVFKPLMMQDHGTFHLHSVQGNTLPRVVIFRIFHVLKQLSFGDAVDVRRPN